MTSFEWQEKQERRWVRARKVLPFRGRPAEPFFPLHLENTSFPNKEQIHPCPGGGERGVGEQALAS